MVFDAEGKFIKSWGREFKGGAHGLHLSREGQAEFFYLCDTARHLVVKTTLEGEVITLTQERVVDRTGIGPEAVSPVELQPPIDIQPPAEAPSPKN